MKKYAALRFGKHFLPIVKKPSRGYLNEELCVIIDFIFKFPLVFLHVCVG